MSVPVLAQPGETSSVTTLRSKDLLGIADLTPEEISLILDTAEAMQEIGSRQFQTTSASACLARKTD